MALNIYESEDFDILEGYFLKAVEASLAKLADRPLAKLEVITSSGAVTDVLTKRLARTYGIAPGVKFDYLAGWFWRLMHEVEPDKIGEKGFDEGVLVWEVLKYLEDASFVSRHPSLAKALESLSPVVVFNLAGRIARVFANYNAYRNDWVLAWIEGRDPKPGDASRLAAHPDYAWQKALWKKIGEDFGFEGAHPSELIDRHPERFAGMPDLHVFVPVSVPPLYLEFLAKLSAARDVFLYVMNPCRAYWFDFDRKAVAEEAAHPLLANWARQTKALNGILFDFASSLPQDRLAFSRTTNLRGDAPFGAQSPSNLELLKHSVFTGETSWLEGLKAPFAGQARAPFDRSLEIHGAYSIKREVEVLVDYLYDLFASDETLKASDVLVLTPELDRAAPVFRSVFSHLPKDRQIAWQLRGQTALQSNTLLQCLALLGSIASEGFRINDLYALIAMAPVARHFELDDSALLEVRDLLEKSGYHSGLDDAFLADRALLNGSRFTLEAATRRMMLKYVMREDFQGVIDGLTTDTDLKDKRVLQLAGFVLENCRRLEAMAKASMTLKDWTERFVWAFLDAWTDPADNAAERIELSSWIAAMSKDMALSGSQDREMGMPVFLQALSEYAEKTAFGAVPSPGVCITGLGSMRLIPYRVVAVLGLNETVFPRRDAREKFDLTLACPRAGDRQRTADDKNVFFDAVLAARDHLYLSFTSRSMVSGGKFQPSGLLSELVTVFEEKSGQGWADWCLEHPIHGFSRENFTTPEALQEGRLGPKDRFVLSFDTDMAAALNRPADPAEAGIRLEDGEGDVIDLQDVIRFWKNPLEHFWTRRLGLKKPEDFAALSDDEPFTLDNLQSWSVRSSLIERQSANPGASLEERTQDLGALSILPSGAVGRSILQKEVEKIEKIRTVSPKAFDVQVERPVRKTLVVDGRRCEVAGVVGTLEGDIVRVKAGAIHGEDVLGMWLSGALVGAQSVRMHSPTPTQKEGLASKDGTGLWQDDYLSQIDREALAAKLVEPYLRGMTEPVLLDAGMVFAAASPSVAEDKRDGYIETRRQHFRTYHLYLRALAGSQDPEAFLDELQRRSKVFGRELAALLPPPKTKKTAKGR